MTIPSNLIPRRIPELPPIPASANSGIVPIVYNGTLYQGDIRTIVGNIEVDATRRINTSAPLNGGGNLQQDLTLTLAQKSISDDYLTNISNSGTYGDATTCVQVNLNNTGRITSISAVPIDLRNNLSQVIPSVSTGMGSPGLSGFASRGDHQHPAVDLSDNNQTNNVLLQAKGGFGVAMPTSAPDPTGRAIFGLGYLPYHNAPGSPQYTPTQFQTIANPSPAIDPLNKRTLVLTCIEGAEPIWSPAGTGAGTIASLLLTLPVEFNTVNAVGSTQSTIPITWKDQASNLGYFLATAASGMPSPNIPSLRRIAFTDLPNDGVTPIENEGSASQTWQLATNDHGSVTSGTLIPIAIGRNQITATGTWDSAISADWTTNVNITGGTASGLTSLGATTAAFTNLTLSSLSAGTNIITSNANALGGVSVLPISLGGTSLTSPSGYLRFGTDAMGSIVTQNTLIPIADLEANTIYIGTNSIQLGNVAFPLTQLSGMRSILVTDPITDDNQLTTKSYVDSVAQGLDIKASCRVATTALLSNLFGTPIVDGYQTVAGDRILVKNQIDTTQNGIYVVSASTWNRSTDANTYDELVGAFTFVENHGGSTSSTGWSATIPPTGTLGVTPITFTQFSGAGTYTAGTGLTLTGGQFSISDTAVVAGSYGDQATTPAIVVNAQGQLTSVTATAINLDASRIITGTFTNTRFSSATVYSNIAQLATVTAGTWNGSLIARNYGGTGLNNPVGYIRFDGALAPSQNTLIPNTDISGLGTMSTQNANNVAITGGTIVSTPIGNSTTRSGAFFNALDVSSGMTVADATSKSIYSASGSGTGYTLDASGRTNSDTTTNARAINIGRVDLLTSTLKASPTLGNIEFDGSNIWFTTTVNSATKRVNLSIYEETGNALAYSFII